MTLAVIKLAFTHTIAIVSSLEVTRSATSIRACLRNELSMQHDNANY